MNADPRVMEHFPAPLTREMSDALVDRIEAEMQQRGFGLWAVEVASTGEFIGFTGLSRPAFHVDWMAARPQPVVEVGWRLKRSAWGHGYATEGARAAIDFGFDEVGLPEIVSFTVVGNRRSQAVMRRIGMSFLTSYDHPVPGADPLPSVAFSVVRDARRPGRSSPAPYPGSRDE